MPLRRLSFLLASAAALLAQQADVIFEGGKIITVDPQFRVVHAMAIRGGRILAVGDAATIARFSGSHTRRIHLHGKTVLPGLIDSHAHAAEAALYEFDHPVPETSTIAEVLNYIRSRAALSKEGDWTVLTQVFITRLRDQRFPTPGGTGFQRAAQSVFFGTGPDAMLNSMALRLSGIDRNFRIRDGKPGRIEHDTTGEPTGLLRNCKRLIRSLVSFRESCVNPCDSISAGNGSGQNPANRGATDLQACLRAPRPESSTPCENHSAGPVCFP